MPRKMSRKAPHEILRTRDADTTNTSGDRPTLHRKPRPLFCGIAHLTASSKNCKELLPSADAQAENPQICFTLHPCFVSFADTSFVFPSPRPHGRRRLTPPLCAGMFLTRTAAQLPMHSL